jgi:hypothetical protein
MFAWLSRKTWRIRLSCTNYVQHEQWLKLTSYCEGDVLNTWLIYLRWLLLKGQLLPQDHEQWIQATIHYLQQQSQHHEFLQVWQQTSHHTPFTQHYFSSNSHDSSQLIKSLIFS